MSERRSPVPELDVLREVGGRFQPPPLEALESVARRRDRRRTGAVLGGCVAVMVVVGGALASSDLRAAPPDIATDPVPPLADGPVEPGALRVPGAQRGRFPPTAVVEVPKGFMGEGDQPWVVASEDPDRAAVLHLWSVSQVHQSPCVGEPWEFVRPGHTVEDLAQALVDQRSTRATTPVPVSLDGHQGLYLELTGPARVGRCDDRLQLWSPGRWWFVGPRQVERLWILDVTGERVMVHVSQAADLDDRQVEALEQMVASITFRLSED